MTSCMCVYLIRIVKRTPYTDTTQTAVSQQNLTRSPSSRHRHGISVKRRRASGRFTTARSVAERHCFCRLDADTDVNKARISIRSKKDATLRWTSRRHSTRNLRNDADTIPAKRKRPSRRHATLADTPSIATRRPDAGCGF
jgi:hypothetical protein